VEIKAVKNEKEKTLRLLMGAAGFWERSTEDKIHAW